MSLKAGYKVLANMSEKYVQVKVEEGILRGQQKTSEGLSTIKYYAFQGIPFAKPPVGDLRFKAPQTVDPWDGVRDALEDGPGCVQSLFSINVIGEEDCLSLNVFTPELPDKTKTLKPVLVSIHGGGFGAGKGGSEVYSSDFFIEHGVLFVSPTYRVGALGFLSLQNDEISGNAGLKDQVQALRWIHKNIKQFGGDPENVTIMGLSAGGASVEYLLMSDLSKGLFNRAIIQSGSTLNTWSMNNNPRNLAITLAEKLGYTGNTKDDKSLESFFKSCSARDIVEKELSVITEQESMLLLAFTFAPCVEKEGKGEKFITTTPREILENGDFSKVPIITGLTNNEGCLYFMVAKNLDDDFEKLNSNWEYFIPKNLDVPKFKKMEVAREIDQFYFDSEPISRDNIDPLVHLIGDLAFGVGISESTNYFLQNTQNPVYCYGVNYETSCSFIKILMSLRHPGIEIKGVPHGGDLNLMFRTRIPNMPLPELSSTDKKYIKIVTTMFTTFAKTGNPNYEGMEFPAWEPATSTDHQYLDIGNELKMRPGRLHEERLQFWNDLYSKYGYLY